MCWAPSLNSGVLNPASLSPKHWTILYWHETNLRHCFPPTVITSLQIVIAHQIVLMFLLEFYVRACGKLISVDFKGCWVQPRHIQAHFPHFITLSSQRANTLWLKCIRDIVLRLGVLVQAIYGKYDYIYCKA